MIFLVSKKEQSSGSWYCSSSLYRWKGRPFGTQSLQQTQVTPVKTQVAIFCAFLSEKWRMIKAALRPGDVFVHEGVEAVVEVAAWKLQTQQWFEKVRPAQLRGEGDVAGLTVKSDDGLNVGQQITPLVF